MILSQLSVWNVKQSSILVIIVIMLLHDAVTSKSILSRNTRELGIHVIIVTIELQDSIVFIDTYYQNTVTRLKVYNCISTLI